MNYQEFILETLKKVKTKPTKTEMEFAYLVLYKVLGLSPINAINESMNL